MKDLHKQITTVLIMVAGWALLELYSQGKELASLKTKIDFIKTKTDSIEAIYPLIQELTEKG